MFGSYLAVGPNGSPTAGLSHLQMSDNITVLDWGFALSRLFGNAGHLIRPALVLLLGVGIFLVIRAIVVPKDFGKYGHYRPGALDMIGALPISYAGRSQCAACHEDEAKVHDAGKHAGVGCEACHGPLAKHVDDPVANVPKPPDVANLCRRCHEKDAAKPQGFPQVDTIAHSQGMVCNTCHQPHSPHL
jgi:hypothetical protein